MAAGAFFIIEVMMTRPHEGTLLWQLSDEERQRHPSRADRYRPRTIEQMAIATAIRRKLEAYVQSGELPHHVILHGPPATGKTTLALILGTRSTRSTRITCDT